MAGQLKVTLVKSAIGSKPKTRGTVRALGLRRINSSNVLPDSATARTDATAGSSPSSVVSVSMSSP